MFRSLTFIHDLSDVFLGLFKINLLGERSYIMMFVLVFTPFQCIDEIFIILSL